MSFGSIISEVNRRKDYALAAIAADVNHLFGLYIGFWPISNEKLAHVRSYVGFDPIKLHVCADFGLLDLFTLDGIQDIAQTTDESPKVTAQNPV